MSDAKERGHSIRFEVLYYAQSRDKSATEEELGAKEGEYIRKYDPPLNTQIPHANNWRKWDLKPIDVERLLNK